MKKRQGPVQLFVSGIPSELTNEGLRNLFLAAGDVNDAKVVSVKNFNNTHSRSDSTYGFVTVKSLNQAEKAIRQFDGFQLKRCRLHVKIAMTAEEKAAKRRQHEDEEEFLKSLDQNVHNHNNNNINENEEKVSPQNTDISSSPTTMQKKSKGRAAQEDRPGSRVPGGASANIHRHPQRDDGYESENFGDLKCVNSSVHMRQVYAQTGLGRGNKGNKSRTNKHFFPGMDRSLKLGQDAGSAFERPPLLHHPDPSYYGPGPAPGFGRPLGPGFGRGYWNGPPFVGAPQGPFGYEHALPMFRPGLSRGYDQYPSEFYRPQAVRPYNGCGDERRSRSRDEGFSRTFINPSIKESQKRKQKLHCIACKQPALKKCSRCKLPYCSVACQKKHFPEHMETCKQLFLMMRSECDPDELDSRFHVTVNEDDVNQFQTSLDQLVTDASDSESIISGKRRPIKKGARRGEMADKGKKGKEKMKNGAPIQKAISPVSYREHDVPTMILPLKTRKKVWVSHVDSPSEVWIQVASSELKVNLISIGEQSQQAVDGDPFEDRPQIGDLCLAKAVGDKWYRCSVVGVRPTGMFDVRYLDFGNMCSVQFTNMRPFPKSLLLPPPQAVRCCIAGIVPVGDSVWNTKAKNVTSSIVRTDTDYSLEAIEKHGDLYLINLFENNSGINVIQRLISAKVAEPVSTHTKVKASDLKSLVDELEVGQELDLYFVDCKSPSSFVAQIIEETRVKNFQQVLKEIVDDMAASPPLTPYRPEVGEMVFGRYTADDCWTRAEVLSVSDRTATIRYIDYGNTEELEFTRITPLKLKFASLPGQAVRCFLAVQQTPDQWTEEDIAKFKEQIGFGTQLAHKSCVIKSKSGDRIGVEIFTEASKPMSDMFSIPLPAPQSVIPEPASPIMADSLKSITLPIDGSLVPASVVDIVSLSNFSVQLVSESSIQGLKRLMLDIAQHVQTAEDRPNPGAGELVCARFSDEQWYRCRVERVHEGQCALLFVDFGNEDEVANTLIKACSRAFLDTPTQAVKCGLAGVGKTSDADLQSFATSVLSCVNNFKVVSHDGSKYEMEIFLSDGRCLNDRFRESSPAATAAAAASAAAVISSDHAGLQKSVPQIKTQPAISIGTVKPSVKEFKPAAISFVTDPGNFCCQLLRKEFKDLSQVNPAMIEYCTKNPAPKGFDPEVGDFCFGQFMDSFYRARVEKKLPSGLYELKYVDYGNVEAVSVDDMRPMVEKYAEIPCLALKCSMHGLQPSGNSWSDKSGDLVREFMGKLMLLKVEEETEEGYSVNLVQNEKPSVTVGEMLVSKGFAVAKTDENIPSVVTPAEQSVSPTIPSMAGSLCVGQKFQMLISNYSPPDLLTVEIVDQNILDKRNELQAELNQAISKMPPVSLSPHVGDYALAQFSEDKQWYRAKIETVSSTKITVFYVDFGNKEDVNIENLRPLPTEWSEQPAFVVTCFVEGVRRPDSGEEFTKEQSELCQKIMGTFLLSVEMPLAQAEVKSVDGDSVVVELYKDNRMLSTELTSVTSPVVMATDMCSAELPIDGSLVDCEFIHIDDLTSFFVRRNDAESRRALEQLMVELNAACRELTETHRPVVGEVVAVAFSRDGSWSRGLVYELTPQACRVNFVDFGNSEQTTFSSIRRLDPQFAKLPTQAILCDLAAIPKEELASERVKDAFVKLVAAKSVKVKVVPSDNQLQYSVEVVLPDGGNVADMLLRKNVRQTVTVESLTHHEPTEREFQLAIQDVVSPSQFYCTELDINAMKEQTELNAELTKHCKDHSTPTCTNLKVGDLCCGLFDGEWYRGEVKEVLPGNRVSLFYIDYGNTNEVDLSHTRVMPKEYARAKVMAIHCRLHDVHPVGDDWDEKAIDFLSQQKEKLLNASVVSVHNRIYKVQLTDPETDTDLAKEMVVNSLALDDATIKKQIEALSAKLKLF